jgi:hypothetical protein
MSFQASREAKTASAAGGQSRFFCGVKILGKIAKKVLTNQDFMIICHGAPKTAGGFMP